ncbi:helix-turn-helix domain-containing protein [Chitinophaga varians]|uniref:helix-turn-helix domain-containing protein n=1 Tax=Chitinophaga varians TaxID=2202339 RepID=UPI00165FD1B1|nr:helix-turn-helix transcriptional regulator [Chitinophaga varians]MBC9911946.1 helix-turn-helix transcriptional regulator [Chitinophaga varians]
MNFGKVIRTLREQKQQNQRDFADYIGISQTSLSLIESGKTTPTDATLDRIAARFNTRKALLVMAAIETDKDLPPKTRKRFNDLFPTFEEDIWSLISTK